MPLNLKQLTLQSSFSSSVFRLTSAIFFGVPFSNLVSGIVLRLKIYRFLGKIGKQTRRDAVVFRVVVFRELWTCF